MTALPTAVYLVRHAETTWNAARRMQGRMDAPLSERGIWQAQRLAAAMRGLSIAAVYASPLGRAVTTAEAVARAHGLPVETLPLLSEMDQGDWENRLLDEIEARDGDLLRAWWDTPDAVRMPNGESLDEVQARGLAAVRQIVARHPGQAVAAVAHGGVNKTILLAVLGAPLASYWRIRQHNVCINHVVVEPSGMRAISLNDTAHLAHEAWQVS